MEKYAIIVAGGSGTRMGSDTPKQYLVLGNKPILMHTLEAFIHYPKKINIILVLPPPSIRSWKELCLQYNFLFDIKVAEGGSSRFESVKNGLELIDNKESLVAIHDGVRPLVSQEMIRDSFIMAEAKGCGIAATQLKESIRKIESNKSTSVDRTRFRLIQTPQTFRTTLIKEAYEQATDITQFTDDASVAEKSGMEIHLFEGGYQNIKITTPEDLIFAEAFLRQKK